MKASDDVRAPAAGVATVAEGHGGIEIRSYRRVFALERRLYRIDRIRLNPAGVPLRGIVYFLALLSSAVLVSHLALVGAVARLVPWYLRDLTVPALTACAFTAIRLEGRPFHLAALALVRYVTGPRHCVQMRRCTAAGRRWPAGELVVLGRRAHGDRRTSRTSRPKRAPPEATR